MTITKEICDQNKCPLVPPNCRMFFLTPSDMHPKALAEDPKLATEIWFSPFESNAESSKSWSHDSDFPISLRRATGGMREIITATAFLAFMEEIFLTESKYGLTDDERRLICYQWREWNQAEPDEDEDEDDDENMPIVFKEDE